MSQAPGIAAGCVFTSRPLWSSQARVAPRRGAAGPAPVGCAGVTSARRQAGGVGLKSSELQVLLLCRWSYPSAVEAFGKALPDLAALRAYLYDPARLDLRLLFLEHVVLPGLRLQTDTHFKVVFMIGADLPEPHRSRLLDLLATVPQAVADAVPEGQVHRIAVREVMARHRDPEAAVVAEIRLDDDDAAAVDLVEMTRALFPAMRPVFRETGRMCLDFCRGVLLLLDRDRVEARAVTARYWACSMVIFTRPSIRLSILDYPHHEVWQRMDTMTWQQRPMFVRGSHWDNDSALTERVLSGAVHTTELEAPGPLLREAFAIDIAAVEAGWARLRAAHPRYGAGS